MERELKELRKFVEGLAKQIADLDVRIHNLETVADPTGEGRLAEAKEKLDRVTKCLEALENVFNHW